MERKIGEIFEFGGEWLLEVHKLHVFAKRTYEYALDKFSWGVLYSEF